MNTEKQLQERIERLADAYFEGETSLSEEKELRMILASHPEIVTQEAEELRAILGLFAAARVQEKPATATSRKPRMHRVLKPVLAITTSAAATVAILIGLSSQDAQAADTEVCFTRVGEITIENPQKVKDAALGEMRLIVEASEELNSSVAADLSLLREGLDETLSK